MNNNVLKQKLKKVLDVFLTVAGIVYLILFLLKGINIFDCNVNALSCVGHVFNIFNAKGGVVFEYLVLSIFSVLYILAVIGDLKGLFGCLKTVKSDKYSPVTFVKGMVANSLIMVFISILAHVSVSHGYNITFVIFGVVLIVFCDINDIMTKAISTYASVVRVVKDAISIIGVYIVLIGFLEGTYENLIMGMRSLAYNYVNEFGGGTVLFSLILDAVVYPIWKTILSIYVLRTFYENVQFGTNGNKNAKVILGNVSVAMILKISLDLFANTSRVVVNIDFLRKCLELTRGVELPVFIAMIGVVLIQGIVLPKEKQEEQLS